jgi:hypothetical protein
VAGRLGHLGVVQPDPGQLRRDPLRGSTHVRRVLRQGGDGGDAQQLEERLEAGLGVGLEVGVEIRIDLQHHRDGSGVTGRRCVSSSTKDG